MGLLSILQRSKAKNSSSAEALDEKRDALGAFSPSSLDLDLSPSPDDSTESQYPVSPSSNVDLEKSHKAMRRRAEVSFQQEVSTCGIDNEDSFNSEADDDCLELPSSPNPSRTSQRPKSRDATEMMAESIYRRASVWHHWFTPPAPDGLYGDVDTGVALRSMNGKHILYPHTCPGLQDFGWAISHLNPAVAMKIRSPVVQTILADFVDSSEFEFKINADTRIQVLSDMTMLARARKHQYAAFIRDEGVLCLWSDNVKGILQEAEAIEELLLDYIWNEGPQRDKMGRVMSARAKLDREDSAPVTVSESTVEGDIEDPEVSQIKRERLTRPTMVYESLLVGCSIIVVFALCGLGYRTLIKGYLLDGKAIRFALVAVTPILITLTSFTAQTVIGSFWQMLGPIGQIARNSRTYSAIAPRRTTGDLPHVTVWLPVYREALEEVIMPTVESLKAAQATYERQGGTVSILVCDDGLQLISPEQVEARKKFYFNNNIAYVARPGHGANGFVRRGRFKKASNMNFAIQLSLRVEEILDDMRPPAQEAMGVDYFWCDDDEQALYEAALSQAIMESEGRAWADGNIRIGAVILIIDSDTRVPDDCFIDAVSEFEESLEVAIIQHSSGVMQVAHHFFENGIAHFTRGIQLSISFCCAGGTMGPFVGHNAFLRWSALQEIMFEEDGVLKVWSEAHVSEDFALSLALQLKGYIIRWATYSKDKFEEGVSLTCDDEVNRWQKYAWGCSELIFNPLRYWFTRGPFSRLFRQYLWSNVPLPGKISNLAYIFSYYAIACAWPMTVLNFVLIGFSIPVDAFYLNGWKILILVLIVFPGLGNLASVILRFRLKVPGTGTFARNQVTYLLFFSVFFTGLSMQILSALICHLIGYQMVWSATVKTVEASNFFKEVPAIIKKFKITLPINVLLIIGIGLTSSPLMPVGWRVSNIEAIVPMAMSAGGHILYPIVLNPWLVHFTF